MFEEVEQSIGLHTLANLKAHLNDLYLFSIYLSNKGYDTVRRLKVRLDERVPLLRDFTLRRRNHACAVDEIEFDHSESIKFGTK